MEHFTAVVEVAKRGNMTAAEVDQAMDRLTGYPVSLSVSARGYRTARITLPADTIGQAATAALVAVTHGFGVTTDQAVSLEVMTEAEADLREGSAVVPELIGVTDAAQILGVSTQRVRQMIDEGKLAAHRVGERAYALVRSEVEATAASSRTRTWQQHPGLRGLLDELGVPKGRVLPSPKIDVGIEHDGPHRARGVARYQFTVLGRYPGGKVEAVAKGEDQEVTVFDITREGDWTAPD